MERWQFNVLFVVGVGGLLFMLIAPAIHGLEAVPKNPTAASGLGLVLTYVLTQRKAIVKHEDPPDDTAGGDQK